MIRRFFALAIILALIVSFVPAPGASADGIGFVGGTCQGEIRAGRPFDDVTAHFSLDCDVGQYTGSVKFCLQRWYSSLGEWKDQRCDVFSADGGFYFSSYIVCYQTRPEPARWRGYAYTSVVPGTQVRVYSEPNTTSRDKIPGVAC